MAFTAKHARGSLLRRQIVNNIFSFSFPLRRPVMLTIVSILALVLGIFAAGAGLFNWEFLFSDGYREHGWVRSLGREGARGVFMLLGSLLALAGFVSQIVDAAFKPVAAVMSASDENSEDAAPAVEPTATSAVPNASSTSPAFSPPPSVARPASGQTARPPANDANGKRQTLAPLPPAGPPDAKASAQAVTIWSPDVAEEETQTFVSVQYRFEAGHKPQPGGQYFWVVNLQGVAHKISFEGETLQKQGQLANLFNATSLGAGFDVSWSTWIEMEAGGKRRQISNRLEIEGEEVRFVPLTATP
jgi:hypothetical protein